MKLDKLDARIKLVMLIVISTLSVILQNVTAMGILLAITLMILIVGGADMKAAFTRMRGMIQLILSIFVLQCLFTRTGEAMIAIKGFTIVTWDGVLTSAVVSLRLFNVILSAMLVLTGEPRDYLLALTQWKIPYEISFMVMAAIRFIPMLTEEGRDVMCAVQMRGTKIKNTSLAHKLSVYKSILIPIVSGAIRRSEYMATAMEARAFRALPKRTSMRKLVLKRSDIIWLIIFILLMCAVVVAAKILG